MRKISLFIVFMVTLVCLLQPLQIFAQKAELSYEGGIFSVSKDEKVPLEYKEVCFITGEPIVFSGTVTVKKTVRQDVTNVAFTYNLKNVERSAILTRNLSYDIKSIKTEDEQTIEEMSFSKKPSETLRINNDIYVLRNYEFSHSKIIDKMPIIDYSAGNMWGRKTYQIGNANSGGTVTVEITGKVFGYDQNWGSIETAILNYEINSERRNGDTFDRWGGSAKVTISSSITKEIKFMQNIPEQISFEGGYVKTCNNSSILEYYCSLPEFDSKGISNYKMIETRDSLKLETFPEQTRLPVHDLSYLRGHWAEEEIKMLYSLGAFNDDGDKFNPGDFITRAEFTAALVKTFSDDFTEPPMTKKAKTSRSTRTSRKRDKEEEIISPYEDIPTDYMYFSQIDKAHKKGLIIGKGQSIFAPEDTITLAEMMVIFIRALGLEDLAPNPYAITPFKDDISIPTYARNAIYAANRIGLIEGDSRGYLKPDEKITKAKAAVLMNKFITYMREGIKEDYQDRIMGYN